jgi:hypothetical protein
MFRKGKRSRAHHLVALPVRQSVHIKGIQRNSDWVLVSRRLRHAAKRAATYNAPLFRVVSVQITSCDCTPKMPTGDVEAYFALRRASLRETWRLAFSRLVFSQLAFSSDVA